MGRETVCGRMYSADGGETTIVTNLSDEVLEAGFVPVAAKTRACRCATSRAVARPIPLAALAEKSSTNCHAAVRDLVVVRGDFGSALAKSAARRVRR
jgi:hypothetical protein